MVIQKILVHTARQCHPFSYEQDVGQHLATRARQCQPKEGTEVTFVTRCGKAVITSFCCPATATAMATRSLENARLGTWDLQELCQWQRTSGFVYKAYAKLRKCGQIQKASGASCHAEYALNNLNTRLQVQNILEPCHKHAVCDNLSSVML